jgi:hypothetical protein
MDNLVTWWQTYFPTLMYIELLARLCASVLDLLPSWTRGKGQELAKVIRDQVESVDR